MKFSTSALVFLFIQPHLNLKLLKVFPGFLDAIVDLLRICALTDGRLTLAASLTANDGGDGLGPFGSRGTLGLEVLWNVSKLP